MLLGLNDEVTITPTVPSSHISERRIVVGEVQVVVDAAGLLRPELRHHLTILTTALLMTAPWALSPVECTRAVVNRTSLLDALRELVRTCPPSAIREALGVQDNSGVDHLPHDWDRDDLLEVTYL